MPSEYFKLKTGLDEFKNNMKSILENLKDKKVIVFGADKTFFTLDKIYKIREKLNIIAIADTKFETKLKNIAGLKQILPEEIKNQEYDFLLVTDEKGLSIKPLLINKYGIRNDSMIFVFDDDIRDASVNWNYLCKHRFQKTLPKLIKKLKNKSVIIYGAGSYFELIKKYYDLSDLNIIAISDKRFEKDNETESFLGYKTIPPKKITELKPDYVLVATKLYVRLIENLYYNKLKGSGIKLKPLVKKSFWALLSEVWN